MQPKTLNMLQFQKNWCRESLSEKMASVALDFGAFL
jgi:hypothetical protein